ncbi:MAG TPA: NADH-quinone oxidoreductase subunit NuoE [Burkholderiaceae bacterium]|nr:NADH-quinone oxidoreductase subunit NuoE [Burkholderiaceae bacterium]
MSAVPSDRVATPVQRLSEQALRRIDREIAKYPPERRQSAVLAALAIAQDEIGWLPTSTMEEVAEYLRMAPVAVYEVATFYHMFNLAPVGRHKITVCTNLPCALSGANVAARHLQEKLGIGFGQTTADGRFTLAEGECMGACGDAPVLLVNNKRMCSFMDASRIDELLRSLDGEKGT